MSEEASNPGIGMILANGEEARPSRVIKVAVELKLSLDSSTPKLRQ